MKSITALIIALGCLPFGQATQAQTPTRIEDLGWLVGTWKRTNNKQGHSAHERWIIDAAIGLRGFGVTMKGQDTVFVEKLRIVSGDDGLYYVAELMENPKPTYFKIMAIHQNEFICEDPKHDFPKKINYKRTGKKLKAIVSGNGKSLEYNFEKID